MTAGDESTDGTHVGHSVFLALLRGDPSDIAPGWRDLLDDIGGHQPVARAGMAAALLLDREADHARALYAPLVGQLGRVRDLRTLVCIAYRFDVAVGLSDVAGCQLLRTVLPEVSSTSSYSAPGRSLPGFARPHPRGARARLRRHRDRRRGVRRGRAGRHGAGRAPVPRPHPRWAGSARPRDRGHRSGRAPRDLRSA